MDKMNDTDNGNVFDYSYSAKRQEEIEAIRRKYLPQSEDKIERLRALDRSAARPGTAAAIVIGTLGTLLLGTGMSCAMVWGGQLFIAGIVIGIVGIAAIALAHPAYALITKKQRAKLAPEILRLTEELSQK